MAIIETKNLTKHFKDLVAVDNVDLGINEGECFGLLGPNGAGKTSLIKMIIGASPPTQGEIRVLGKDLKAHSREIKAVLGVVSQTDNLDPDLTVLQNLLTFARYFDIPKTEAKQRALETLGLFELKSKLKSDIRELSGGMKRRLMIARALINHPRILILDEPTTGLDPQSKYLVWRKLTEFKSQGVTQLLCTQNMEEAQTLCDRVAVMNQGKILSLASPQQLIAQHTGNQVWEIRVSLDKKAQAISQLQSRGLDFEDAGDRIHIFHSDSQEPISGLGNLAQSVTHRPATLEDVFFRLTGRFLEE